MKEYQPPLDDIGFCLEEFADLPGLSALPGLGEVTPDLVSSVLTEAARLATAELAPLNRIGDRQGSRLENGVVVTPDGFREAYAKFAGGGWTAVPFAPEHGGQGLPWSVATALQEMWGSA